MREYHKIDSVYKRDERGKFLIGEFSRPEFEYLKDNPWQWTEKIDGTNIRVMYAPDDGIAPTVRFGGKTDNAQIPTKLLKYLQDTFDHRTFSEAGFNDPVTLYGEGYGAGIQKGGENYGPDQKFILFDVKIGDWWLERKNVEDIAAKLGIDVVADIWPGGNTLTLSEMIRYVADDPHAETKSRINSNASIEGYVGTPLVSLFNRKGERIITKIKYRDFR